MWPSPTIIMWPLSRMWPLILSTMSSVVSTPLLVMVLISTTLSVTAGERDFAFFNSTSLITIPNSVWDLQSTKQVTFRTCSDSGNLLSMRGSLLQTSTSSSSSSSAAESSSSSSTSSNSQELALMLHNTSVLFLWSINGESSMMYSGHNINNNKWYTVRLKYLLGSIQLTLTQDPNIVLDSVTVANSSINSFLLDKRLSGYLSVGDGFSGCMYQGPGVSFASSGLVAQGVVWDYCPLAERQGCSSGPQDIDDCWNNPCQHGATCIDGVNNYTCKCPPNYNGTHCENDLAALYGCAVSPCLNGGTCIPQEETPQSPRKFTCTCAEGYTGVICESTIDVCRTQPCQHGTCISGINTYTCNCTGSGYTGVNCSVDINECDNASSCGTFQCFNLPGGFSCDCPAGYDGTPCQNVDECLSRPCQNGGTCEDGINSFTCQCALGYTGPACETNVDDCASSPCTAPNSRCEDLLNAYICLCKDGFSGTPPNCQDIDECSLNICQNNAPCSNSDGGYTCSCLPGYTGKNCSVNIDDCSPDPCQNNATCEDQVNGYICTCLPGFTGQNCQTDIDDCIDHQCINGAQCEDQINGYKCICQPGWTGRYCEADINECDPNPCQNGAQCHNLLNAYNCTCRTGFDGIDCSNNINDCSPDPCENGGECFDGISDFTCNCTSDWMGKNCSQEYDACSFQPCQNGANCSSVLRQHDYTCYCLPGFTGKDCETNIDDCVNHNCETFEICYDGINSFTCGCPVGFTGAACETEINECETHPCQNNGTCKDGQGNYTCTCQQEYIDIRASIGPKGLFLTGYSGKNCEIDINECAYSDPPICQAQGLCVNDPAGGFTCYCKAENGRPFNTGTLCEQVRSYCDIRLPDQACQHGGTCVNLISGFKCDCAAGFTGDYCEIDIDECASSPCQYNGTCDDRVNGYICTCIEGITGPNCETNIDDCEPDPCLNGGQCQDHINSFTCDCTDTGFTGDTCENNIDDCVGDLCQHGGSCVDGVKEYSCDCLPGYTGNNCETDIPECTPSPCQYNSTCLEYSNEDLYDKGDPNFVNFNYSKAAGYLCVCVPGVTGVNCSEDIDECESAPCLNGATCENKFNAFSCKCAAGYEGDSCETEINECDVYKPCQNGGICEDRLADYECKCPKPVASQQNYGGKNCTTYLRGCDKPRLCYNGDCIPKLVNASLDEHGFDCLCHAGFTGTYCERSTDVSFNNTGDADEYIMKMVDTQDFDLSLRFRTTVPNGMLVLAKLTEESYLAVQLKDGRIEVKYRDFNSLTWILTTQHLVNNSAYHQLRLLLTNNITVELPMDRCTISPGSLEPCYLSKPYRSSTSTSVRWMYIGSAKVSNFDGSEFARSFIGCMEDITLNGALYYPGQQDGEYILVSPGCPRTPQCQKDSCSGNGFCKDLWYTKECVCYRPYYGAECELEYQSATFGLHNDTFAEYNVPPGNYPTDQADFSFFTITRQDNGFIMYIGNVESVASYHSFMTLYLEDGKLMGDFCKCGHVQHFVTSGMINDGQRHFISGSVRRTLFEVFVDSEKVYESAINDSSEVCPTGFSFYVRVLQVGQPVRSLSRTRRDVDWSAVSMTSERISEMVSHRYRRQASTVDTVIASYTTMDHFQGVIQDIQVNNNIYAFNDTSFVVPITSNVTVGAFSTRDVCQDGPCENGGTCTDIFYNDFECDCVRGYTGKNCSEPDFCSYGTCPTESTCRNLQDGYECISTASFFEDNSMVKYTIIGATPEPVLTFDFRTRGLYGLIFLLRQGDYFFKVRVANGRPEINWKLSSEFSHTATSAQSERVDDGQWYSAEFEIINGTTLKMQIFKDGILYDEINPVTFDAANISVEDMLRNGEIILGNTDRVKYSQQWEANFKGCLKEVRMGGLLMPFFPDYMFENNTAANRFSAERDVGLVHHCTGRDVCSGYKCLNGGQCIDEWNDYSCQCASGFEGQLCEYNPDNCLAQPCQNGGQCIDGPASYTCLCPKGYSGNECQTNVDLCNASNSALCENNASCRDQGHNFICDCPPEFTGWYCNVTVRQSCTPDLCKNQAVCSDIIMTIGTDANVQSFNCSCPPGYEGPLCEKVIDYCNKDGLVCENNGVCVNHPDFQNYTCNCTTEYKGINCSEKVDDCNIDCHNGACNKSGCICLPGFTGAQCETPIDFCQNGSYCQHSVCENNICNCNGTGWTGNHCEINVNECNATQSPCQHNGNCTDTEGGYGCDCTLGYRGDQCQIPDCSPINCENGGNCNIVDSEWKCNCPIYVEGVFCQSPGPCFYNPCNNASTLTCSQSVEFNNYTCTCRDGWRGQNCTENINECTDPVEMHQCVNGTCEDTPGSYNCNCEPGFTGRYCEQDIDECASNPCQNGGTCLNEVDYFDCVCSGTGYTGDTCSVDINECQENTTICNQGKCINKNGTYECNCEDKYLGDHCEFKHPCYNNTSCMNQGVCVVNQTADGTYVDHCNCQTGFQGVKCEKSPSTGDDGPDLGVIIGPIVGGVLFIIIIIVIIAFVMTARSKRATRGAYSPSQQETSGSRVELGNVLKKPPEERLI